MNRRIAYYDRIAAKTSLNWTITCLVGFSVVGCAGLFQLLKYLQGRDQIYLFFGPINISIGMFGIFLYAQIIHAIVRQHAGDDKTSKS
jgi:hypothetical protein